MVELRKRCNGCGKKSFFTRRRNFSLKSAMRMGVGMTSQVPLCSKCAKSIKNLIKSI
jgi:hypothetical protein